ncbi:MAG TPA: flagellar biosynthetic protein FliR [Caulifigura sp.]|jgi:flagellar biosynthetic protein FliR|nr:flagellar biosynthetic protein FliR [Caulifigura sp.]
MNDAWSGVLILMRTASFIAAFPPWAGRSLPHTVKVGLAIVLTVFWVLQPAESPGPKAPDGMASITIVAMREIMMGVVMAQVMGLVLVPPRIAGSYVAQEMGLTFAALTSPMDQHPSDPIAQVFEAVSLCLFFALDAHHYVFRVLDASWRSAPVGSAWPAPMWARCAMASTSAVEIGLTIAAAVAVLLLIVTVWMALATRMAPQMHVFAWGSAVRIIVGLGALLLYLPDLLLAVSRTLLSRQAEFLVR